jgi:demethylmenaquinone methyltransferase/2-methoxy-6-polyprenyl-1,4-benzoquinol methylase
LELSKETRDASDARLVDYYRRRAGEYEAIYAKPERQADLAFLEKEIPRRLRGARVLEVACGTGYWTERVARSAAKIVATDAAEEPMRIARSKSYPDDVVRFELADAYALEPRLGRFDAGLAVFWWSHVPRPRAAEFLDSLHRCLEPGARVLFMDNVYAEGSSTPVSEVDAQGNTYQMRQLADGSRVRVLKNFPSEDELRERLAPYAESFAFEALEYYWLVEYRVKKQLK